MTNERPHSTPRTLLIIDDQESVRVSLEYLLGSYGYNIVTAASGMAALAILEQQSVDGALIDVHMPGLNGFDTLLRLQAKANETGYPLRAWMMTGAWTRQIEMRAAELGALAVLRKPFHLPETLKVLSDGFGAGSSPMPAANCAVTPDVP